MSDEKHANDEYVNPTSATAAAPVPPEVFPEQDAEDKEAAQEAADKEAAKTQQRSGAKS